MVRMTKTTHAVDFPDFNQQLKKLVKEHIAACRTAMLTAVEQAFPASVFPPAKTTRRTRGAGKRARGTSPRLVKPLTRRTQAEMAAVNERLYQLVCAKPGESKATLAAEMGMSASELNRPMSHLKNVGTVRTVGQRHLTRYFPLVDEVAEAQ